MLTSSVYHILNILLHYYNTVVSSLFLMCNEIVQSSLLYKMLILHCNLLFFFYLLLTTLYIFLILCLNLRRSIWQFLKRLRSFISLKNKINLNERFSSTRWLINFNLTNVHPSWTKGNTQKNISWTKISTSRYNVIS